MQKSIQEYIISNEEQINDLHFELSRWDRIFFTGDLGAGKSTFIRHLLRKHFSNPSLIVRSPTYTYYQKYENIFHCDLYRIDDFNVWISIGGKEISDSPDSILLIEWPQILGENIKPTKAVHIEILDNDTRKITITIFSE